MSNRMGNEMILELAALLNTGMNKTAAKKDDKEDKKDDKKDKECKKCKCDPCECDKKKKEDKKDKDDKKKEAVMSVLVGLSKLAADLDEVGADEASSLVDEALHVIVQNLADEKKKVTAELEEFDNELTPEMPESFEDAPWREKLPEMPEPSYEGVAGEAQGEIDLDEVEGNENEDDFETLMEKIGPDRIDEFRDWLNKKRL